MIAELTALSAVFSACAEVVPGGWVSVSLGPRILRVRGGSSEPELIVDEIVRYSPRARR